MTVITHARRKSRLSQIINAAGGISVGVAVAQARANVESMRTESMATVDAEIAALETVQKPATLADQAVQLAEAYRASNAVIDAASPFDLIDLCRAAATLCDVIDASSPEQMFDWRIVTVHARALRLLQTLPMDDRAAREQVLGSLEEVLKRKAGS